MTHTLQRVEGELRFQPPKTRTSRRTVPLPGPCVAALRAHKVAQDKERLAAGPKWCDEDMVFSTTIGTPIEPDNLSSWYKTIYAHASLDEKRTALRRLGERLA